MDHETYSERKRRLEKAGQPDVHIYHQIPEKLRNQVAHIWNDALGEGREHHSHKYYALMEKTIAMAEGRPNLAGNRPIPDACRA
jgi:hypothetical protein